jgi:methionine-rich copper-binding protein CopC
MRYNLYILLSLLLLGGFLLSCGSRKSPTGGEKDTEKPEIVAVSPEQFSDIHDKDLEVTFSKSLDRTTLVNGLYIYPPIYGRRIRWDRNTLIIRITEDLEEDTNYYFSFSPQIRCERGNELDKHYTFVYHTGKLHENRISGNISYEEEEDKGKTVTINVLTTDSVRVFSRFVRGDHYEITNLNPQPHLLQAYIDKNNNRRLDLATEPFHFTEADSAKIAHIDIEMTYQDTIKPDLRTALVRSANQIELQFSKEVVSFGDLEIVTADSMRYPLEALAYSLKLQKAAVVTEPMESKEYNIIVRDLLDKKDNLNPICSLIVEGTAVRDSIPPRVIRTFPRHGSTVNNQTPTIEIEFSEIILRDDLEARLSETDTGRHVEMEMVQYNSELYKFKPKEPLRNYVSYTLHINALDPSANQLEKFEELLFIPIVR